MNYCPVQGESKTLIRLTLQKPEISAGSIGHLARKGFSLALALTYKNGICHIKMAQKHQMTTKRQKYDHFQRKFMQTVKILYKALEKKIHT